MSGARRAIWGLVNDGYALAARTSNLTYDEAAELSRVPDIGDPTGWVEDGVAFLSTPRFGYAFARVFTNAERDSAGRASLVYDVVALSAAEFAALRNDPFRVVPARSLDRRPESAGELEIPKLTARDERGELDRLSALLDTEDRTTLATLVAAVLVGDRVLWLTSDVRPELLEALLLLFPVPLRTHLTFQTLTVDYPKHPPRLLMAERAHAALAERDWSVVLPRDAGDPRLAESLGLAEKLIALAQTSGERLGRAAKMYELYAGVGNRESATATRASKRPDSRPQAPALNGEIERVLRFDTLLEGLRAGDLKRATLALARASNDHEDQVIGTLVLQRAGADAAGGDLLAGSLADLARGGQRGAWVATLKIVRRALALRAERRDSVDRLLGTLISRMRDVQWPQADASAAELRAALAEAAVSLGDTEAFLDLAEATLPWESPATAAGGARRTPALPVGRVLEALERAGQVPEGVAGARHAAATDVVTALAALAATELSDGGRRRAAALALAVVRRAVRDGVSEPAERLPALGDALLKLWKLALAQSDDERALRRLLTLGTGELAPADARRVASDIVRIVHADAVAPEQADTELLGWALLVLRRVHDGALPEAAIEIAAAMLDAPGATGAGGGRTEPMRAVRVGQVLLELAGKDPGIVFRPAWRSLVGSIDAAQRRELFARGLGWVVGEHAARRYTLGAVADACAALGREGMRLDESAGGALLPYLRRIGETRPSAAELGVLLAVLAEISTPAALGRLEEHLLHSAGERARDGLRLARLAAALQVVEAVRDEEALAALQAAALRLAVGPRAEAQADALSPEAMRIVREFLGLDDRKVLTRLLGGDRLTSQRHGPGNGRAR